MTAGETPNEPAADGVIAPVATMPEDELAYMEASDTYAPDMDSSVAMSAMSDQQAVSTQHKNQVASLSIAVLVHAVLLTLLAWVVIKVIEEKPPELVVASAATSNSDQLNKREFSQSVKNDKPSPPSASATQLLAATATSSLAIPMSDKITPTIDIGSSGFGAGFGGGGDGNGLGASSFFGTTAKGKRIILVIDTSTSMPQECKPSGIKAIRKEIDKTVAAFPPSTVFNIICYGNMADGLFKEPTEASPNTKHKVKYFMEGYFGQGPYPRTRTETFGNKGTDPNGIEYIPIPPDKVSGLEGTSGGSRLDLALVAAFDQKASTIFLITDGIPSTQKDGKRLSENDIVRLVAKESDRVYGKENRPVVNCISVNGIGEGILKDIARRFKGKYKSIEPSKL